MPQQTKTSIENNFTGGLKTEYTGLNFPENACVDADNTVFTITGDVTRRMGFDFEKNFTYTNIDRTNKAITNFRWDNAGGDGNSQILVMQVGSVLNFYRIDIATLDAPLSTNKIVATVSLVDFATTTHADPTSLECQYSDGNGCLFVYNPACEPFVCTYVSGVITATAINVQIRDFTGMSEPGVAINSRPAVLSDEHLYNLTNQGWTSNPPWNSDSGTNVTVGLGTKIFTVNAGMTVSAGDVVSISINGYSPIPVPIFPGQPLMAGPVISYSGSTLTVNITSAFGSAVGQPFAAWHIVALTHGQISTWFSAESVYPSNSDVWWTFKNASNAFDPSTTVGNTTLNTGYAPRGHFLLNAFTQTRNTVSGISTLTPVITTKRPKTGAFFNGRVWFSGIDDSQAATGDAFYNSWSEDIYFSQIISDPSQYGMCYQVNDPTSETLFDLLPTDGGVIKIQGCGSIYKLFPIQNGILVFAARGIWFITGRQGIGFTANDYTITKISSIQSISGSSFISVQGYPMFWNEEGIYYIQPAQQGLGLNVDPITVGTILSFYAQIPLECKKFARGDYDPINYVVQWCYSKDNSNTLTARYEFDRMLNYNVYNKAFYTYSVEGIVNGNPKIHGVSYVAGPGGSNAPDPTFKYTTSNFQASTYQFSFSEERDTNYKDWISVNGVGADYVSFFTTGYKLHGEAQRKFQAGYIFVYSKQDAPTSYKIQGIWDYAINPNSGKFSTPLIVNNNKQYFGHVFRRHRIRGLGTVLQFKVSSIDGKPFDIIGWSIAEQQNAMI